jgi:dihydrofolate reductase
MGKLHSHLLQGDAVEAVRTLKRSEGLDITVLGSGKLVAQLGEAGLVDRYQFVVVPIALGGGRTVFTEGQKLRLVEHRVFPSGKVAVTYSVTH